MTIEEFNNTKFSGYTKIIYKEIEYEVRALCFEENLIGFNVEYDDDINWVRCENVTLKEN